MSFIFGGLRKAYTALITGSPNAAPTNAADAPPDTKEEQGPAAVYPEEVPWDEHPCLSCDNPCSSHKQIPDYLKIDYEEPLLGSMKPYRRHVLFTTPGRTPRNWVTNLEQEEASLAMELSVGAKAAGAALGCRVIVTAVDDDAGQQAACAGAPLLREGEVLVLPEMVALGPITAVNARTAIESFLVSGEAPAGMTARAVGPWRAAPGAAADGAAKDAADGVADGTADGAADGAAGAAAEAAGAAAGAAAAAAGPGGGDGGAWASLVLVCAHKLRDKRCGVAAPLIMEELRAECTKHGLGNQVAVMGCSHVGGHKFAGNLIVYGPGGGHWYGRVKPCHAAAIVDTHIVQGRVIKELWRGRMDA
ncbi:hypothetical protein FOA52_004311 [Chlamydomonas sp. UWO 241]|nr:hypothetical protein FOA52_004311 [Chlamydomonas sp. UWO 241]